jgi:hypothetical protein
MAVPAAVSMLIVDGEAAGNGLAHRGVDHGGAAVGQQVGLGLVGGAIVADQVHLQVGRDLESACRDDHTPSAPDGVPTATSAAYTRVNLAVPASVVCQRSRVGRRAILGTKSDYQFVRIGVPPLNWTA